MENSNFLENLLSDTFDISDVQFIENVPIYTLLFHYIDQTIHNNFLEFWEKILLIIKNKNKNKLSQTDLFILLMAFCNTSHEEEMYPIGQPQLQSTEQYTYIKNYNKKYYNQIQLFQQRYSQHQFAPIIITQDNIVEKLSILSSKCQNQLDSFQSQMGAMQKIKWLQQNVNNYDFLLIHHHILSMDQEFWNSISTLIYKYTQPINNFYYTYVRRLLSELLVHLYHSLTQNFINLSRTNRYYDNLINHFLFNSENTTIFSKDKDGQISNFTTLYHYPCVLRRIHIAKSGIDGGSYCSNDCYDVDQFVEIIKYIKSYAYLHDVCELSIEKYKSKLNMLPVYDRYVLTNKLMNKIDELNQINQPILSKSSISIEEADEEADDLQNLLNNEESNYQLLNAFNLNESSSPTPITTPLNKSSFYVDFANNPAK